MTGAVLPTVRVATVADAAACASIYRPYVLETATSFELEAPDEEEFARRIATALTEHCWLVLERAGRIVGYAYAVQYKPRGAYQFTCEVSVYLEMGLRRSGGGRALYDALLAGLAERGHRQAIAGVTLPNDASIGLHRAMGFELVGILRQVGWKFERWHDVALLQRPLGKGASPETPTGSW